MRKKGELEKKFYSFYKTLIILFCIYAFAKMFFVIKDEIYKQFIDYSEPEKVETIDDGLDTNNFNILASEEMKDLENILQDYAKKNKIKINVDYAGTLEIMDKLNEGRRYDAIWASNSIWTYMIDSKSVSLKDSKATSITPIVFGIKKSKAEELGFVGKDIYTKDILDAVSSGKLKFAMSNPIFTNSGASAYLGMLYTFAGNPEVLTEEVLNDPEIKNKMKAFFSGLERTSGSEDFLEELFLNGDYESVFSYEFSIININKKLEAQGKEPLYAIYPIDGVSISDNPFVYVDNKNDKKEDIFNSIQDYLVSKTGQKLLEQKGRRTWYGGINKNADKSVFNPKWGIDTTKYITPVKYPSSDVIKLALDIYQSQFRKPIHVVFCLDYSGSMLDGGVEELRNAMKYILSNDATKDYIQFSEDDIIDVVFFSTYVDKVLTTNNGTKTAEILSAINNTDPYGGTAIYDAAIEALNILKKDTSNERNCSVILMTDGMSNIGSLYNLRNAYDYKRSIPIYSIMFGDADNKQLEEIAKLTNGKVFDGKKDLVKAFKEVRGYN